MRYMYLVSAVEDGKPPPERLMVEMDKLARQELVAGRMISQGGLLPTLMGSARIELRRGKVKVIDGPFTETKEVLGGYAIFEFATREEAPVYVFAAIATAVVGLSLLILPRMKGLFTGLIWASRAGDAVNADE